MWGAIASAIGSVFTSWIDSKKAQYEAEKTFQLKLAEMEANWDLIALRLSQYSWKDELITLVWFAPLIIAWFDPEKAQKWLNFVGQMPPWYQVGMFGIIAASFGLRWFFKQQGLKIGDK